MSDVSVHGERMPSSKTVPACCISKVIELHAESSKGWEDAVQMCLAEAIRTVKNITSISVSELSASVHDDVIQRFQVSCKVAFAIDDTDRPH